MLTKVKLNLTVVFSSVMSYLFATGAVCRFVDVFALGFAGFLVTGSANALNQVLEKDYDKLMKRTRVRPLPTGRMGVTEAVFVAGIMGVAGIALLAYFFNNLTALLGALSLLSYAFIYTPLKRIHSIAVVVGAVPGALPVAIGWVAATSLWSYEASVLFAIQFLWQFPHFWAIGWLAADEYYNAGFRLFPMPRDRNKRTAFQAILYIVMLVFVSLIPCQLGLTGFWYGAGAILLGLFFLYYGLKLHKYCTQQAALHLMFASIIYLPLLQILLVLGRLYP